MRRPRIKSPAAYNTRGLPVFDPVKLDLAVIILIALAATLVVARLDAPQWVELLIIAAVGVGSGTWIVLRTRRVVRICRAQALKSMRECKGGGNDP
jgi:hypothetical protein